MEFVSVRVITADVERLAAFWEQVTGLPVARPVPVFAELRTPAGTIAIGAPATVAVLGDAAPAPGQNHSAIGEPASAQAGDELQHGIDVHSGMRV